MFVPMFDPAYVQGYLAALQDVRETFEQIDGDMRRHGRKRTAKEYQKVLDTMIEGRSVLRENPDAFVRCRSDGGYEVFDAKTRTVV